jgi:DNA-binding MarR family transcriptional regulator
MRSPRKTQRRERAPATQGGLRLDPQHPWRHENIGRLLLSGLINWQDLLVVGLQEKGFRRFRASHMNLLRHIDLGGTRISEIAERARLSKQAVSQLVVSSEDEKLVKTIPDPSDRRAKIVTFTNLGRAVIDAERDIMVRIDAELKKVLGQAGFRQLGDALALLAEWSGPFALRRERARSGRRGPRKPQLRALPAGNMRSR